MSLTRGRQKARAHYCFTFFYFDGITIRLAAVSSPCRKRWWIRTLLAAPPLPRINAAPPRKAPTCRQNPRAESLPGSQTVHADAVTARFGAAPAARATFLSRSSLAFVSLLVASCAFGRPSEDPLQSNPGPRRPWN